MTYIQSGSTLLAPVWPMDEMAGAPGIRVFRMRSLFIEDPTHLFDDLELVESRLNEVRRIQIVQLREEKDWLTAVAMDLGPADQILVPRRRTPRDHDCYLLLDGRMHCPLDEVDGDFDDLAAETSFLRLQLPLASWQVLGYQPVRCRHCQQREGRACADLGNWFSVALGTDRPRQPLELLRLSSRHRLALHPVAARCSETACRLLAQVQAVYTGPDFQPRSEAAVNSAI